VRSLLTMKAEVDMENRYGDTAISLAADEGYLDVVKLLLKRR
jgi:ankyrin repeat protein